MRWFLYARLQRRNSLRDFTENMYTAADAADAADAAVTAADAETARAVTVLTAKETVVADATKDLHI